MRVTHVIKQFHPLKGGMENFAKSMIKAQRQAGYEADVVTLDRLKPDPATILESSDVVEGIPVRRIPFMGSFRYPIAPGILKYIGDADIVHVHGLEFASDFLGLTRPLHKKPLVLTTHGGFFHSSFARSLKKVFFSTITPLTLGAYDRVFACSHTDYALFKKVAGDRLMLMENGVDTVKFREAGSREHRPTFFFIGRFAETKGIDRLIESFARLVQLRPEAELNLVGTDWGGLLPDLQGQVSRLSCNANIKFHIDLADADVTALMARCCYFISGSRYEGFALSARECMAGGLLPVLSDIGCYKELLEISRLGCIADFENPDRAARQIDSYISETTDTFSNLRASAIEAVLPYDWSTVARRTTDEYERILLSAHNPKSLGRAVTR